MVAQAHVIPQHKRHGTHQKRSKNFVKVYLPYLPLLTFVGLSLWFTGFWQQRTNHGVLAYATSISINALLQSSNQQRAANGVAGLKLNSRLDAAAQAKANDMVARNYWSHNTPDGNPPWVFIDQAGYSYKLAGENLAYGFMTSEDTIAGWMNSPAHRDNLLNSGYIDVGFGFANSENYQNSGPETIVVAMYGAPLTVAAPVTSPPPAPTNVVVPQTKASTNTKTEPQPTTVIETNKPETAKKDEPVTSKSSKPSEPTTKNISRLQALTQGSLPWVMSAVTIMGIAAASAIILKHGIRLHKVLLRGERFLERNLLFDVTLISFIGLCIIVSRTAGFIK